MAEEIPEVQVQRLLAAIFPTRKEKALQRLTSWAYTRSDAGLYGFVGDWASELQAALLRVRVWRKMRRG